MNRQRFSKFYMGGIFLAGGLGILIVKLEVSSLFLLIEGIGHLLLLVYLGYKIKIPSDRMYAGDRIQTAGYLHTLVGFSVAISLLGTGKIEVAQIENLQQLLAPMGSALVTSIIGWLLGGEIAGEIADKQKFSLEKAIEDIGKIAYLLSQQNQTLELQNQNFRAIKQTQVNLLREHQQQIIDLYMENNQALDEKINKIVEEIGEYNQSISEIFTRFNSNLEEECNSLHYTFSKLNAALEEQSISLQQTFRRLISAIESADISQSFNRFNSIIDYETQELPPTFKRLHDVIEENSYILSTSFVNLETESQQAADSMSKTAQYTQDTADNMLTTAKAALDTANYIRQTDVLIQQIEVLLKYINEERTRRGL